ncbi:YciK family oxidoreductase [Ectothiorhodospiraceae bacterium BW-2]|nr:YciK family oxidoreductase [Ectothiorhodospiraceae bacterium BW-2]
MSYQPPPQLLEQKVILITGAGEGIGAATARATARHGATTILLGRTIAKLEAVYDQIVESGAPQPAIYPLDLEGATVKDYHDLAATLSKEFGRLDGLVHNAAQLGALSPIEHANPERWLKVMQVNLNAPFLLTQAVLGLLKAAEEASIIFTASSVGRQGRAYWAGYGVSKGGVEILMQTLAAELESHTRIRVNSLDPGAVRTSMRARAYPGEDPQQLPAPDALSGSYLYLLGSDSRHLTGQQLTAQS